MLTSTQAVALRSVLPHHPPSCVLRIARFLDPIPRRERLQRRRRAVSALCRELRDAFAEGGVGSRILQREHANEYYYNTTLYQVLTPAAAIFAVQRMRHDGFLTFFEKGVFHFGMHVDTKYTYFDDSDRAENEGWREGWPKHCWCERFIWSHISSNTHT